MQVNDILTQMGGVSSMASQLGLEESQAQRGAEALLPALLGGFKKQLQTQPNAIESIGGLLGELGGSDFLSRTLGQLTGSTTTGNDILGQVFGSKDLSRTVVDNAAQSSGLDVEQLKKMLPMLAMMVAGFMAKQRSGESTESTTSGSLGGLLGGLLGGSAQQSSNSSKSGLAGLVSMFDLNGDGNPLDDIVSMMKK